MTLTRQVSPRSRPVFFMPATTLSTLRTQVLVIGSGAAGLTAAIAAGPQRRRHAARRDTPAFSAASPPRCRGSVSTIATTG